MNKMVVTMGIGWLLLGTAHAEVYKCKDAVGKIKYQSTPCTNGEGGAVHMDTIDPNVTAEAQAKLAEQVRQDQEQQAVEAEAAARERQVQAQEAIAEEIRNQTDAINRNTEVFENRMSNQPDIYVAPVVVPSQQNTGRSSKPEG